MRYPVASWVLRFHYGAGGGGRRFSAVLEVRCLRKSFAGFRAVDSISLAIESRQIAAVIGPNGAGKSTFFNLITGHLRPDGGQVLLDGRDITGVAPHRIAASGVARSFQTASIFPRLTVAENVQAALIAHRRCGRNFWSRAELFYREETASLLAAVGLETQALTIAGTLAHGNRKQLELGIALASEPRVLLLDEPTAGMSAPETEATMLLLCRIARERALTLLFTEHDMDVVFGIAEKIAVLHQGRLLAAGPPEEMRRNPEVRRAYLGARQ